MGATISIDKKVAGFVRDNGEIVYITFEETCSKRDHPRVPSWDARAIGSYEQVMEKVFASAACTEGGSLQTRSGCTTPEAYLQRWRLEFRAPVPMPDMAIELKLGGTSMYATIHDDDVAEALAALTRIGRQDLVEALQAGPITLHLHGDVDVILAIYGVTTKIPLWKIVRGAPPHSDGADWLAPPKRNAPVMAPTVDAYRVDERNALISVGGAPYEHVGWDYSALAQYVREVALPMELRCDGAAKKMISAFREKLNCAPALPTSTTLTITPAASDHEYYIDNARKLAAKLGIASDKAGTPAVYKVTFGDVKAAGEEYLLSMLQATQVKWDLALDNDTDAIQLPARPRSQPEQPSLF